jgi:hypothetical protein
LSLPKIISLFTNPTYATKLQRIEKIITERLDEFNRKNPHTKIKPNPNFKGISTDTSGNANSNESGDTIFGLPLGPVATLAETLKNRDTARMLVYVYLYDKSSRVGPAYTDRCAMRVSVVIC